MIDEKKVIKGLECCANDKPFYHAHCDECPYNGRRPDNMGECTKLYRDALELLKEQEERKNFKVADLFRQFTDDVKTLTEETSAQERKEGMEWEDYKKLMPIKTFETRTQVDIKCPKCGKKIWRRNDITLTTYPEQYQYECECGWVGYAFI